MKKMNKIKIGIAVLLGIEVLLTGNSASASNANISSKDEFVFEDGTRVAFYANDIHYLQQEIEALFNEME